MSLRNLFSNVIESSGRIISSDYTAGIISGSFLTVFGTAMVTGDPKYVVAGLVLGPLTVVSGEYAISRRRAERTKELGFYER